MSGRTKYAVGVDLWGTNIKIGLVSQGGKIINKLSIKTESDKGPQKVIENITTGIHALLYKTKVAFIGLFLIKGTKEDQH